MRQASGAIRKLYNTQAWKKCRKAYWAYRGGLCERCQSRGLYTPGTQVHHKIVLTEDNVRDPAVVFGFDNLQLLCDQCHHETHDELYRRAHGEYRRWSVSEDGTVYITPHIPD